jgi:hypothetical protein
VVGERTKQHAIHVGEDRSIRAKFQAASVNTAMVVNAELLASIRDAVTNILQIRFQPVPPLHVATLLS